MDSQILLYQSDDGKISVNTLVQEENIWLSQKSMAQLFDCSVDNVALHLKNIFKTVELSEKSVAEDFSVTATDGKNYRVKHYNLDAVISVGYRVNSLRGTQSCDIKILKRNSLKIRDKNAVYLFSKDE